MPNARKPQNGATLLETLAAMLVLSAGALGVLAAEARMLAILSHATRRATSELEELAWGRGELARAVCVREPGGAFLTCTLGDPPPSFTIVTE